MRYRDGRRSICLSSQSGCPLTCTFCATGQMRFGGNLTRRRDRRPGAALPPARTRRGRHHCVFMGMGEPMMNLDNVLEACERLPDLGISHRRTAISTVGWIPGIERLAEQDMPMRLALSLHAPEDALRAQLMPVNERYPLADVLDACRAFYERAPARVRRVRDARRRQRPLRAGARAGARARAARGRAPIFKVNLIPYNPTDSPYRGLDAARDRRLPRRARVARRARDRAPDARARHRRRLRSAGGKGRLAALREARGNSPGRSRLRSALWPRLP